MATRIAPTRGAVRATSPLASYAAMLVLVATGHAILAAGCVAASGYRGRSTVARIRVVCPACVTVAALNALILVDPVR